MGTLLTSTSRADGAADTTGLAVAFDSVDVFIATCANSSTAPPSIGCDVLLQLSTDNSTWTTVDRRHFGIAPGITYEQKFELSDYVNPYQSAWAYARLVFGGNVGAAVTVAAANAWRENIAVIPLTASTATTGGKLGSWANPGATRVLITKAVIDMTTASSGACTLAIGTAANATTSSNNIIDALSAATIALGDNITDKGSAGKSRQILASGSYVTVTGSADSTGLAGNLYIYYVKP